MATAYVLINCELGSEESIISQLKNHCEKRKKITLYLQCGKLVHSIIDQEFERIVEEVEKDFAQEIEHMIFLQKLNPVQLRHYERQSLGRFVRLKRLDQL